MYGVLRTRLPNFTLCQVAPCARDAHLAGSGGSSPSGEAVSLPTPGTLLCRADVQALHSLAVRNGQRGANLRRAPRLWAHACVRHPPALLSHVVCLRDLLSELAPAQRGRPAHRLADGMIRLVDGVLSASNPAMAPNGKSHWRASGGGQPGGGERAQECQDLGGQGTCTRTVLVLGSSGNLRLERGGAV